MPTTVERPQAVVLLTGIMAAGKSTVAQALAERLPRSVHVRGDVFRRMVVNGRADMTPDTEEEARRQLRLRHTLTADVTDGYFDAGFTVVAQDVVLGAELPAMVARIRSRPLLVVVLAPSVAAVAAREAGRPKTGYGDWTPADLDAGLRAETPRIGLWLDTSAQTPEQTVDEILSRAWSEAAVPD
ncbi:AAA family ATPase [Polymorphospora rubra]|uniref:AAA family ATPase n=1 Tax=Polymorphospora rubra TaxID=338584 RepID=UPI003405AF9F